MADISPVSERPHVNLSDVSLGTRPQDSTVSVNMDLNKTVMLFNKANDSFFFFLVFIRHVPHNEGHRLKGKEISSTGNVRTREPY